MQDRPLGDPNGTRKERLLWKLGFRLVPTREERVIGLCLMVMGTAYTAMGLAAVLSR